MKWILVDNQYFLDISPWYVCDFSAKNVPKINKKVFCFFYEKKNVFTKGKARNVALPKNCQLWKNVKEYWIAIAI